jgi:hypothetical protein
VSIDDHRPADVPPYATYDDALARLERETVRSVNAEMRGQDEGRVHAVLVSQLEGRFPGVELNHRNLKKLASAISQGTLTF